MSVTFYTPCATPRPVRLSEATRRFADESLHGRYGDDALRTPAVALDDPTHPDCLTPAQFAALSDCGRQDAAIAALAKYAPVRLCEGERICGAATCGLAISAFLPVTFGGNPFLYGVNHLTVDFFGAVREGLSALEEQVCARLSAAEQENLRPRQLEFLCSAAAALRAFRVWSMVSLVLVPPCTAGAVFVERVTGWQVWVAVLVVYIASLFGAIVIPAKRFE